MTTALNTFNNILNVDLRPWIVNYSPQKYQQELPTIKKETYQFQPLYDLAFPNPLSEKRKYYHTLIENAAITFLNSLHNEMESAPNDNAKAYYLNKVLDKQLNSKLREVSSLIERKNYQFANMTRTNDDAYIIQYLKYQLVRLYLEVQDYYPDEIEDEPLTPEDIVSKFFSDPFEKGVIIDEVRELVPERRQSVTPKAEPEKFIPHNHEIREAEKGILTYEEIVAKPQGLERIEAILFNDKYIDKDFVLTDTQGNIKKLAAVGQVLYQNKFFNRIAFHNNKKVVVEDVHVKDFLSHRYKANIGKEFRRFRNPDTLKKYINANPWIGLLPTY